MKEPIQDTYIDKEIKIKPGEEQEFGEPFDAALAISRYQVNWIEQKKAHTFYCSDYQLGDYGEWQFYNVVEDTSDTSKPSKRGEVILKRQAYIPVLSLFNVPFVMETLKYLPAKGDKEEAKAENSVP